MLKFLKDKLKTYIDHRIENSTQELQNKLNQRIKDANNSLFKNIEYFKNNLSLQHHNPGSPQKRYVFICGFARNATSILSEVLNSSTEVFIGSEINVHMLEDNPKSFLVYGGETIEEQFNNRKISELPICYKGAFIPGSTTPSDYSLLDFLNRNTEAYQIAGDKMALSDFKYGEKTQQQMLDSFCQKYPDAIYFFTLRSPSEVFSSFSRMFPNSSFESLVQSLLETWKIILTQFLILNQSYIIFADDITGELLPELEEILDTKLNFAKEYLGRSFKSNHKSAEQVNALSSEKLNILEDCEKVFGEIRSVFDKESTLVKKNRSYFISLKVVNFCENIDGIIDRIGISTQS
ncbi:MAG: hypothetical protein K0U90_00370 [Planctomycetes bacterium]|nr:hypothetical protein [Planctomycetota bacterium]